MMKKKLISILIISFLLLTLLILPALAVVRDYKTWVPNKGNVAIWESGEYYGVYIHNEWYWNSSSDLSGLKADTNETLEMDTVFYNYDGTAFSYNYIGGIKGTYWDSNQPRPYQDTQFDDGIEERPFSVGCADANQFVPQKWYYYWVYGDKYSDGSQVKIQAQRGYRSPSNVYSTWNIFSEQTYKIVPFDQYWAPGSKSWTRP